jgi:hypothetical protein
MIARLLAEIGFDALLSALPSTARNVSRTA